MVRTLRLNKSKQWVFYNHYFFNIKTLQLLQFLKTSTIN